MSKITTKKKSIRAAAKLKELRAIHGEDYGKLKCESCGGLFEPKDIVKGMPDPFTSEIYNDNKIVEQCKNCYNESCWDI